VVGSFLQSKWAKACMTFKKTISN